jgi:hypothetical protein
MDPTREREARTFRGDRQNVLVSYGTGIMKCVGELVAMSRENAHLDSTLLSHNYQRQEAMMAAAQKAQKRASAQLKAMGTALATANTAIAQLEGTLAAANSTIARQASDMDQAALEQEGDATSASQTEEEIARLRRQVASLTETARKQQEAQTSASSTSAAAVQPSPVEMAVREELTRLRGGVLNYLNVGSVEDQEVYRDYLSLLARPRPGQINWGDTNPDWAGAAKKK